MNKNNIIETYKNLYSLLEISYTEEVNFDFFRLLRRDYKFLIICLYNEKKEFLLTKDLNKNIGWELIGGYLLKNERIEDGINRIVLKESGLSIDELEPLVSINNNFKYKNEVISHFGISFLALTREKITSQPQNIITISTKKIPEEMAFQNKKILELAHKKLEDKVFEPPFKEIEASKRFLPFYFINKYLTKPIIGKSASNKIQDKILKLINEYPTSILDVSCGDDDLIFLLNKIYNPEICVANDISWKLISLIKNKDKENRILFTNHNILTLPFKNKFDLVIFKNTLHHIPFELQIRVIRNLLALSKQLIICDLEDPNRSTFLTKLWHWYYIYLLSDQGGYFLSFEEFKGTIRKNFENRFIVFNIFDTIKGRYFLCSLSGTNQHTIEIEIKARIDNSQIELLKKRILELGASFEEKIKEKDIYFTAPHRDFIKTKECLRIRKKDNYLELTYKGPTTKLMESKKQFWKSEVNIPLAVSEDEVENLLQSLGFKKIVEVVKEREKFVLGKQEISIDKVENAGWFLEIENTITDEKERQKALNENINLFNKLGLDEKNIITEPYRDLVLR